MRVSIRLTRWQTGGKSLPQSDNSINVQRCVNSGDRLPGRGRPLNPATSLPPPGRLPVAQFRPTAIKSRIPETKNGASETENRASGGKIRTSEARLETLGTKIGTSATQFRASETGIGASGLKIPTSLAGNCAKTPYYPTTYNIHPLKPET
jgi:hypothetical protein